MIDPRELRSQVIKPALERIGLYSPAAANLLLGTAIVESTVGRITHLVQRGGPALGIYQVEPSTHRDTWENFLRYRGELRAKVDQLASQRWRNQIANMAFPADDELVWNLGYATAIARIKYYRDPMPLPGAVDLPQLGLYWKRVYNTGRGAGSIEHWLDKVEPHRAVFLSDD